MKIALVDDEVQHLTKLHELLASELLKLLPQSRHQIDSYSTSQAFLQRWKAGSYDVIILDIFMGDITGVDIAKEIRRTDPDVKLVFCSRSNEFAAESYQVNAQYYLVKPPTAGAIINMLQRLNLELIQLQQTITLPDGHHLLLRRILYSEYYNHVVTIQMKDGTQYRLRTNHGDLEALLSPCGFICSPTKGILVNFHEIANTSDDSITMTDGTVLPISRRKNKDFLSAYTKFRFHKMRSEVEI